MELRRSKLDPELERWGEEAPSDVRTVILRIAYSQDPAEAADLFTAAGMEVQSAGPGVVVATSNYDHVVQASDLRWVIRIDFPQRLGLKSRLLR